jgi:hypothetical protein
MVGVTGLRMSFQTRSMEAAFVEHALDRPAVSASRYPAEVSCSVDALELSFSTHPQVGSRKHVCRIPP